MHTQYVVVQHIQIFILHKERLLVASKRPTKVTSTIYTCINNILIIWVTSEQALKSFSIRAKILPTSFYFDLHVHVDPSIVGQ